MPDDGCFETAWGPGSVSKINLKFIKKRHLVLSIVFFMSCWLMSSSENEEHCVNYENRIRGSTSDLLSSDEIDALIAEGAL